MGRIPVAAVLVAGVQVIGVNRVSATGAMLPGVWRKARRFQAKLLTEPRLVLDPPKSVLLFEDIDCLFEKRTGTQENKSTFTFSNLLNLLDGVFFRKGLISRLFLS